MRLRVGPDNTLISLVDLGESSPRELLCQVEGLLLVRGQEEAEVLPSREGGD